MTRLQVLLRVRRRDLHQVSMYATCAQRLVACASLWCTVIGGFIFCDPLIYEFYSKEFTPTTAFDLFVRRLLQELLVATNMV